MHRDFKFPRISFQSQNREIKNTRNMSRDITKPTKWVCTQWRLRSAWVSTQSDQSLHCLMKKAWVLSYPLSAQRKLVRLGGCPGWSESLLGAHSSCCFCRVAAHIVIYRPTHCCYSAENMHQNTSKTGDKMLGRKALELGLPCKHNALDKTKKKISLEISIKKSSFKRTYGLPLQK